MGFPEFLEKVIKAFTPSTEDCNCSQCMNCKARIKQLPSGQQIRVFTCPLTEEFDDYTQLPAVNPSDLTTLEKYIETYIENLSDIETLISNCIANPGGRKPMVDNNYQPITRYEDLKYCTNNIFSCGHFKPRLFIDNSGSTYIKENEMIVSSYIPELYFDNLSEEDKKRLEEDY